MNRTTRGRRSSMGSPASSQRPSHDRQTVKLAERYLQRWAMDPVSFLRDVFGMEAWKRQEEIMMALTTHKRVAVRSGHKVSKSFSAALLALWWVCTRPDAHVVFTSAADFQVKQILWAELKKLYSLAEFPIGGHLHDDHRAGLTFKDGRYIIGMTTKEKERMAGFSGENLLYICDEASGIADAIFEAIDGNRAGGGRVIMFSNPTKTDGYFYNAFHDKRKFWKRLHISSEETPNAITGESIFPGLATKEWLEEMAEEWGEDSVLYRVRARGEFPEQGDDNLTPLSVVEEALIRWKEFAALRVANMDPLEIGLDVARYGDDDSVACPRRGRRVFPLHIYHHRDSGQLAGEVLKLVRDIRLSKNERPVVRIDANGLGWGVYDRLKESDELEAIAVNVSERAINEDKYERRGGSTAGGLPGAGDNPHT